MAKINETNYPRRTQASYEDTDMFIIQESGGNTYTTRIEDIREDCQETLAPAIETVNDALAPPENGSTASQAYAIGEHFMRDGAFCTAIAAIASGASFTLNTNYVVGTIAEALESLNSELTNKAPLTSVTYSGYLSPVAGDSIEAFLLNFKNVICGLCAVYQPFCVWLDWQGRMTFLMQGIVTSATGAFFTCVTYSASDTNYVVLASSSVIKQPL